MQGLFPVFWLSVLYSLKKKGKSKTHTLKRVTDMRDDLHLTFCVCLKRSLIAWSTIF